MWAPTGVKNPTNPDTKYVTEVAVPRTVNTVPEATLNAFADHGSLRRADNGDPVTGRAAEAREVIDAIAETGVDLAEVFTVLKRDGVDRFTRSWAQLHETVRRSMEAVAE